MSLMTRLKYPDLEPAVEGETRYQQQKRTERNRLARAEYRRLISEKCARCGLTRNNVVHEDDRRNAPEGLDYYADVPFCDFLSSAPRGVESVSESREYLTLDEAIRALGLISDRNLGTVTTIHSYRTHTGDPFPPRGMAEWGGPLAHEIRVQLAVNENYLAADEVTRLLTDLRDLGFEAYFTAGDYDKGYLQVVVGRQGQQRVMTAAPSLVGIPEEKVK
jgi:hypothetical protein